MNLHQLSKFIMFSPGLGTYLFFDADGNFRRLVTNINNYENDSRRALWWLLTTNGTVFQTLHSSEDII